MAMIYLYIKYIYLYHMMMYMYRFSYCSVRRTRVMTERLHQ